MSVPRTHDVALDSSGNIFATCCVDGAWPTTPGAFQRKYGGGNTDFGIVKLSPTGKLLACTYLGGSGDEINGPDTLSVGKDGSVLITSGWGTTSPDYPVTAGCFQPSLHGKNNAVFSLLSNDLGTLLYSTFMGGQGTNLRANAFGPDGSIWVAGHSPGPEWPLKNPYPNARKAGLVLAKFSPVPRSPRDRHRDKQTPQGVTYVFCCADDGLTGRQRHAAVGPPLRGGRIAGSSGGHPRVESTVVRAWSAVENTATVSPPAGRCSNRLGMATDSKDRTLYDDWKARRERLAQASGGVSGHQAIEMRVLDYLLQRYQASPEAAGQHGFRAQLQNASTCAACSLCLRHPRAWGLPVPAGNQGTSVVRTHYFYLFLLVLAAIVFFIGEIVLFLAWLDA